MKQCFAPTDKEGGKWREEECERLCRKTVFATMVAGMLEIDLTIVIILTMQSAFLRQMKSQICLFADEPDIGINYFKYSAKPSHA